jgi:hypothetical protein
VGVVVEAIAAPVADAVATRADAFIKFRLSTVIMIVCY